MTNVNAVGLDTTVFLLSLIIIIIYDKFLRNFSIKKNKKGLEWECKRHSDEANTFYERGSM